MILSAADLNVILAALRLTSTANEANAREALAKGDRNRAMRLSAFAYRCGELSDQLEKGGSQSTIIRAN